MLAIKKYSSSLTILNNKKFAQNSKTLYCGLEALLNKIPTDHTFFATKSDISLALNITQMDTKLSLSTAEANALDTKFAQLLAEADKIIQQQEYNKLPYAVKQIKQIADSRQKQIALPKDSIAISLKQKLAEIQHEVTTLNQQITAVAHKLSAKEMELTELKQLTPTANTKLQLKETEYNIHKSSLQRATTAFALVLKALQQASEFADIEQWSNCQTHLTELSVPLQTATTILADYKQSIVDFEAHDTALTNLQSPSEN